MQPPARSLRFVILSLGIIASSSARAQDTSNELGAAVLRSTPAVPLDSAATTCLTFPRVVSQAELAGESGPCHALGFWPAGRGDGALWGYAVYRRWVRRPSDSAHPSPPDSDAYDQVVLFSADTLPPFLAPAWPAPSRTVRPEWLAQVSSEGGSARIAIPEVVAAPDGGALVSVTSCVNDTAGCRQDFWLRRGGNWSVLRLAFVETLEARFPGARLRGIRIDPVTLTGRAGLASPDDPECCASRGVAFHLALERDQLVLRSVTRVWREP